MDRRDSIRIVPYDSAWPALFEREARRVQPAVEPYATGPVEHMGSTAVPGLAAKPIIDMLVPIRSYDDARSIAAAIAPLGWLSAPEPDDDQMGRASFCFPDPAYRTHHLHAIENESPRWRPWLAFRDALRDDPALVGEYAALKARLAAQFAEDRDSYRSGKTEFVHAALRHQAFRQPS
jgi:GrpB-like predicted nucleotidyltransferase (UPF0157 family)